MRLSVEMVRALAAIAHFGEATYAQVAKRSGIASGSLSPLLARLEGAGWIASREDGGPLKFGRATPRVFYRVADEGAVRAAAEMLRGLVSQILEDLS
jgi:PadR family transcriptional regulator, regulatory protein PadR